MYGIATCGSAAVAKFKCLAQEQKASLLRMGEILHQVETMGNRCWLVFPGEYQFLHFLGGAGFRPSAVGFPTSEENGYRENLCITKQKATPLKKKKSSQFTGLEQPRRPLGGAPFAPVQVGAHPSS